MKSHHSSTTKTSSPTSTGVSSGLSNGSVLVSMDTNFLYKRKVLSLTDDPGSHTVSLVTTQASLAECVQQGIAHIPSL